MLEEVVGEVLVRRKSTLARSGEGVSIKLGDETWIGRAGAVVGVHVVGVRVGAFVAICLSGLAGATIGLSLISIQCEGDCGAPKGIGLLVGALIAAGGMAVVAVLVMRALGEWHEVEDRSNAGHAPR